SIRKSWKSVEAGSSQERVEESWGERLMEISREVRELFIGLEKDSSRRLLDVEVRNGTGGIASSQDPSEREIYPSGQEVTHRPSIKKYTDMHSLHPVDTHIPQPSAHCSQLVPS
ncbi:MAG: hypothetical protein J0651_04840, partial [Actinobacteria bacterium]|nr:hypothetical protein [Actinomycetota bacterium]